MDGADLRQRAVSYYQIILAAERRVRHDGHVMLLAPRQEIALDAAVVETVCDLIGGAAMAVWNAKEILHLANAEIGYAPGTNLPCRAQLFKCRHHSGELRAGGRPMHQIKIQVLAAETSEARRASTRDAIAGHLIALHLGDQVYAVALTGDHFTDELFGSAAAVVSRRIDQRHAERNTRAQRLFFDRQRVPTLTGMPAALTELRDDRAVGKLYGPHSGLRRRVGPRILCSRLRGNHCTQGGKR